ncbi:MAG: 30S ribosomal protein S4 [Candidatus Staskawiczbacteria bacterium]|nr:30S ribosomal protein S4 [Candidatus Staskawiczbacteria bacterium]
MQTVKPDNPNPSAPQMMPQRKRRGGTPSEYKKSLQEKQILKRWYGLSERQFKKYVKETLSRMGRVEDVANELIRRIEKRLDNAVFRLGLASSRAHARQLVAHGIFLVNGKPVNIPSFELKTGDIIAIKESKKSKPVFKDLTELLKRKDIPSWLSLNKDKFEGKTIGEPSLPEVSPPAEISLIFEFYSR